MRGVARSRSTLTPNKPARCRRQLFIKRSAGHSTCPCLSQVRTEGPVLITIMKTRIDKEGCYGAETKRSMCTTRFLGGVNNPCRCVQTEWLRFRPPRQPRGIQVHPAAAQRRHLFNPARNPLLPASAQVHMCGRPRPSTSGNRVGGGRGTPWRKRGRGAVAWSCANSCHGTSRLHLYAANSRSRLRSSPSCPKKQPCGIHRGNTWTRGRNL